MLERHLPPSADLDRMFPNRRTVGSTAKGRAVQLAEAYGRFLILVDPGQDPSDADWDREDAAELLVRVLEFETEEARRDHLEGTGWTSTERGGDGMEGEEDLSAFFTRPNAPDTAAPAVQPRRETEPSEPTSSEGAEVLQVWSVPLARGREAAAREGLRDLTARLDGEEACRGFTLALRGEEGPPRAVLVVRWRSREEMEGFDVEVERVLPVEGEVRVDVLDVVHQEGG